MSDGFKPNEIRGSYDASGMRFGLVVSRFNGFITERLLAAALDRLGQPVLRIFDLNDAQRAEIAVSQRSFRTPPR